MKEDINFLFGGGFFKSYQVVLCRKEDNKIYWIPGNQDKDENFKFVADTRKYYIGFTGKVFEKYTRNQREVPYFLHFIGIDIDDFTDYEKLPEIPCSIRLSKSGQGLHLIFRIHPIYFEKGERCNFLIKETLKPFVEKIENVTPICKACFLTFFMYGGKNKWLKKTDEKIYLVDKDSLRSIYDIRHFGGIVNEENLTESGRELVKILRDNNIINQNLREKYQIYVKSLFDILKGTKFAFKTNSQMSDGKIWHVNGFITFKEGFFQIFTNADNKIVYKKFIGRF